MASLDLNSLEVRFTKAMADFSAKLEAAKTTQNMDITTIDSLNIQFNEFKSKMLNELTEIKTQVAKINQRCDDIEVASRKRCLLFHGVPESDRESCEISVVDVLIKKMGLFHMTTDDLDFCYRLGSKYLLRNHPRPILATFISVKTKQIIWSIKRKLKGSRVLISEYLTSRRLQIYKEARITFKTANTWTNDGKIKVLFPDGKIMTMCTQAHLDEAKKRFMSYNDENDAKQCAESLGKLKLLK